VAAELGLEPGGALGHAYLVPYKQTCTLIVGYRGLIELAHRSGEVSLVRAVVVHERDSFKLTEGFEQMLAHEPYLDGDAGALKYVYCVVVLKSGARWAEVMSRSQVDAIRARSQSANSGPWVTDYDEMAKKTAVRRALKYAPLSSERLERAMEVDSEDYIDGQVAEQVLAAPAQQLALKERMKTKLLHVPADVPAEAQGEAAGA
jgi:recombination protein RecT